MKIKYETNSLGKPATHCPNKVAHNGCINLVGSTNCMFCDYFGHGNGHDEIVCYYDINNQAKDDGKN